MSFRLGELCVNIGYEAVAALTAVLLLDRENRIVLCIAAATLHELGHLLMMRLCGVGVRGISLRLFDVRIDADAPRTLRSDLCVTLGGAGVNLLLAAVFMPMGGFFGHANLALGCFNLLPVFSLDGGRALYLLLMRRYEPRVCRRVIKVTSFLILLPLMTAGFYTLIRSGYNYSLLTVSLYLTAVLLLQP